VPVALAIGAGAGGALLGLGGRLAMRLFALATGRPPAFNVRGTLTVVFAGAVAGLLGGVLFWLLERRLPRAAWWRGLTFGAVCLAVAAPGIRPPQLLTFSLFAPFFLSYGLVVTWAWGRWRNARSLGT